MGRGRCRRLISRGSNDTYYVNSANDTITKTAPWHD
jgi:hypothetical protein